MSQVSQKNDTGNESSEEKPAIIKKPPKSTHSKLSFNHEVTVINYNKYNQKLLSPPKPENEEGHSRLQGLKVAKKQFKKR